MIMKKFSLILIALLLCLALVACDGGDDEYVVITDEKITSVGSGAFSGAVKDATLKLSVDARKEMEKRLNIYGQEDNRVVENSINISNTKEMPDISHSGNMQGTYIDNADETNN